MKLKFGTGGLRAVMGSGEEEMNLNAIRTATMGVVSYIKGCCKQPKAAIAYDTRKNSDVFARETARILALEGCHVFIFPIPTPTPLLSFAVRELKCDFGVCITASHNPKEYNGYKVYGADGCQITNKAAGAIQEEIESVRIDDGITNSTYEELLSKQKISHISEEMNRKYLQAILCCRFGKNRIQNLGVVYTPLNGTGLVPMLKMMEAIGVKNLNIVKEQTKQDGEFTTCPVPNPEEDEALLLGKRLCEKVHADILLATDPDSDRIGVAAKRGDVYERLSGNQLGVLLLDYVLKKRREANLLSEDSVVFKTIVTTSMAEHIAAEYGVQTINTLTGFKYIGEQIGKLESSGQLNRFVLGVEESCGYLIGPYVRDKDAIGAAMIVCEMADEYKREGMTLWGKLESLYQKHGKYQSELISRQYKNNEAKAHMSGLREKLRKSEAVKYEGNKVLRYEDYIEGLHGLPPSDVIRLWLDNDTIVVIRPSGTEPKIKIYKEHRLEI